MTKPWEFEDFKMCNWCLLIFECYRNLQERNLSNNSPFFFFFVWIQGHRSLISRKTLSDLTRTAFVRLIVLRIPIDATRLVTTLLLLRCVIQRDTGRSMLPFRKRNSNTPPTPLPFTRTTGLLLFRPFFPLSILFFFFVSFRFVSPRFLSFSFPPPPPSLPPKKSEWVVRRTCAHRGTFHQSQFLLSHSRISSIYSVTYSSAAPFYHTSNSF